MPRLAFEDGGGRLRRKGGGEAPALRATYFTIEWRFTQNRA